MQPFALPSLPPFQSEAHLVSVTVVITTYNDEHYLPQALASVFAQKHRASEIIVVDDGSKITPASMLSNFSGITLISKLNGGLASARNVGLRASHSQYVCFLDADDLLTGDALTSGLACFRKHPEAAMIYGGHRRMRADGSPLGDSNYWSLGDDPYLDMLKGNQIGMHGAVLYRRDILLEMGGFNEHLRRCEDYELYLRISRDYPIAAHSTTVAMYRWHGQNMSRDTQQMLNTVLEIHEKHRPESGPRLQAWIEGRHNWTTWYTSRQKQDWGNPHADTVNLRRLGSLMTIVRQARHRILSTFRDRVKARFSKAWPPRIGSVNFGSFSSTTPASRDFGWDRGTPVDRYYIQKFLAKNAQDIRGRVLEIGDDAYSRRYGGDRVTQQDVLHIDVEHPTATLKGDLLQAGVVPDGAFDCIVFTQTLQVIFELDAAVERLRTALKPGGVLLLTVPGISQIDRQEWRDIWSWAFTATSVRRLFEKHFDAKNLEVTTYGNVFAATTFLFGLALEEIDSMKLDQVDQAYPCIITLRSSKNA